MTAKRLLDAGLRPIVLERGDRIGGVWNYDDEARPGSLAYRSLRTNTSRQTMPFTELAFDASEDFPARGDALAYLHRFTDVAGVRRHIRFGADVRSIEPVAGGWRLRLDRGAEAVDAVVVATGIQSEPSIPAFPGVDRYRGTQLHSSAYRSPEPFSGRRVVVVGLGSSGVDIAAEIGGVARKVVVSAPSGAWLLPRHVADRPWDHHLTRAAELLPRRLRLRAFEGLVRAEYRRRGLAPGSRGLRLPLLEPLVARVTPGSDLLDPASPVEFRPGIAAVDESSVTFADRTVTDADAIVWCTGYTTRFPSLPAGTIGPQLDLVDHVFSAQVPGIAFVGMTVVGGPIWPVMDLQASWIARVFAGDAPPRPLGLRRPAGADPLRVEYVPYLRALATAAGRRDRQRRRGMLAPVRAADFR